MSKIHAAMRIPFSTRAFHRNFPLQLGGCFLTHRSLTDKRHGSGKKSGWIDPSDCKIEGSDQDGIRGAAELHAGSMSFVTRTPGTEFRAFSLLRQFQHNTGFVR